jgi:nucleoside-diphosphate kinase
MERTLVLIKPDAMQRGLATEILNRLERRGLRIAGLKLMQVDRALAERHYGEHVGKPFFEGLVTYITSCPIIAAVFEGTNCIESVRNTMGKTNPKDAAPARSAVTTVSRSGAISSTDRTAPKAPSAR